MKLEILSHTGYQNQFKIIKYLHIRGETIKLLEQYLHSIYLGKDPVDIGSLGS